MVAPVVALMQWKHEIETHAEGFTVCLWHGQQRMKASELKKYDVVSRPLPHTSQGSKLTKAAGAVLVWNTRGGIQKAAEWIQEGQHLHQAEVSDARVRVVQVRQLPAVRYQFQLTSLQSNPG